MPNREELLAKPVLHFDMKMCNPTALVNGMRHMANTSRDVAKAADIYHRMLDDAECGVILCLTDSLVNAGLKQVFIDLIRHRMVDAVVSTGANIVDQDFFEALGFRHYVVEELLKAQCDDNTLRELHIDRICDRLIDEDELHNCDHTIHLIADALPGRAYSSRDFIREMGMYLAEHHKPRLVEQDEDSIVLAAFEEDLPIFCPAFCDCSAGFGLMTHQQARGDRDKVSIDCAIDYYELAQLKIACPTTGLLVLGGGVTKTLTNDMLTATEALNFPSPLHKYAVQLNAPESGDRSLAANGEGGAKNCGRIDALYEQSVNCEVTLTAPLVAGYAYHSGVWKTRKARRWGRFLESLAAMTA